MFVVNAGKKTQEISGSISTTAPVGGATEAKQDAILAELQLKADLTETQPVSISTAVPVTDNSGSLTVDAPVATPVHVRLSDGASAITTLPVSLASVPSHPVTNAGTFAVQSTNQANSGVDIGDVTINNAAGASAVNIQDGGNTITVDGTVAVTDNAGSLTVDAPVGTPVFVRLSDGSSAIATLPVSLASVPSHAVTNAGTFAVQAAQSGTWTVQPGNTANTTPWLVKEVRASTPSQSSPSVTNASTSVLASNANRLGATIYNEGAAICYLKLGATASTTSYSCQIASGGYYEVPFGYTGAIDGITSSGTAQLRVTEIT